MKGPFKNKQGSTLLEIIVAIAILGLMVAPVCASLVLSFRLNAESDKILQARLLVESTVEQLMAEGLMYEYELVDDTTGEKSYTLANVFPKNVGVNQDETEDYEVNITISSDDNPSDNAWYAVIVESKDADNVIVKTNIRISSVEPKPTTSGEGGDGA